ncbi:MAG: ferrous iron transport protein A [Clostridia bacterium]|nr:ferrous iron transport protein A [Clostridia bacterium]
MREINNAIPLTLLKAKEKAKVVSLKTDDKFKVRKLTAFGIMPGVEISVIQKYPAVVIQVGFTQVALDDNIASQIIVSKVAG